MSQHNDINDPSHYELAPGIEAWDVIEATLTAEELRGFCLGNILKYRLRAGQKNSPEKDLAKANWYRNKLRELAQDAARRNDGKTRLVDEYTTGGALSWDDAIPDAESREFELAIREAIRKGAEMAIEVADVEQPGKMSAAFQRLFSELDIDGFGVTGRSKPSKLNPLGICCLRCWKEAGGMFLSQMVLCPTCGNKRCPKSSDHRLRCTGSNEPGQAGQEES